MSYFVKKWKSSLMKGIALKTNLNLSFHIKRASKYKQIGTN